MSFLHTAEKAAKAAGIFLKSQYGKDLAIDETLHHDLKLAVDKESQDLIFNILQDAYPDHALFGEEGIDGNQDSLYQWIVDPIDGTVNFFYGIPHFCVSIALRKGDEIILGVIYDPITEDYWCVEKGGPAYLNGKQIFASSRTELEEAILSVGCGKTEKALEVGLERFRRASLRARKMRMMGSAALGMAYIACGRLDGYIESTISLWDIAAGKLLVEAAGGSVELTPRENDPTVFSIVASNGKIPLEEIL
jgi:myo-inositol-1(or 4)-monophosphatase